MKDSGGHNPAPTTGPQRPPEPAWDNFPTELTAFPHWAAWQYRWGNGRWTKVPLQPDGRAASSTNPETWCPFEYAQCAYFSHQLDGIGFILSDRDPFCVVDLDHCRDRETGRIDPIAASYIARLNSYTEISVSGCGIHVFVRAKLPPRHRRLGHFEIYDSARFITVSGAVLL